MICGSRQNITRPLDHCCPALVSDSSFSMSALVTEEHVSKYEKDGYLLIDNFLTPEEVVSLQNDVRKVIAKSSVPDVVRPHVKVMGTEYLLKSVATTSLFFESKCVSPEGKLTEPLQNSINRIGHGCHVLCEGARAVTFSSKMCEAVQKLTGFKKPTLTQSMFLLKQARHGDPSPMHEDETYVMSEPEGFVAGVWIALDDSLAHNGCLEFVPGSHKTHKLTKKWIRTRVEGHEPGHEDESIMKFVDEDEKGTASQEAKDEDFVKAEVKSGGLVLINGLVTHRSNPNNSNDPRYAYTFHFYEKDEPRVRWSPLNWAQELEDFKFPSLY